MEKTRAILIYSFPRRLPRAYAWCAERDIAVEAVVPKDQYGEALTLINEGRADIIVAASNDSLDPDRIPRLEVVPNNEEDDLDEEDEYPTADHPSDPLDT